MKFLSLIIAGIVAVNAAAHSTTTADKENKEIKIRNELKQYGDDARKRAVMVKSLLEAEAIARKHPNLTPQQRQNLYERYLDRGKADAAISTWHGGWLETSARAFSAGTFGAAAAVTFPTGAGPLAIGALGVLSDQAITSYYEKLDKVAQDRVGRNLSQQEIVFLNNLADLYFKKNPEFKKISKELDIGEFKIEPEHDLNVQQQNVNGKVVTAIRQALKDNTITPQEYAALKKMAIEEFAGLKDQVTTFSKVFQKQIKDQEDARQLADQRENLTGSFAMMGNFATVLGDPQAAQSFNKMAQLSGVVFDITQITAKTFQDKPFACVNMYLVAATLAMDLFKGAQENSEFSAIMAALQQIAEQIRTLREEMHKRFDQLEYRLDHYFYLVLFDLNQIKSSQASIAHALNNLQHDLNRTQSTLEKGLDAIGKDKLRELDEQCLGIDINGKTSRINTIKQANACFGGFVALARGDFSGFGNVTARSKNAIDFDRESFPKLVQTVSEYSGIGGFEPYSPAHFISGVVKLSDLINLNPKYKSIALTKLDSLINYGDRLDQFHRTMALEQIGSQYHLRMELFENLLNQYLEIARSILEQAQNVAPKTLNKFPWPGAKWKQDLQINGVPDSQFTSFWRKADLCSDPDTKLKVFILFKKPILSAETSIRGNQTLGFGEGAELSSSFLKLIPSSARWATFLGDQILGNHVYGCFSQVDISHPFYISTNPGQSVTANLALTLDLYLAYSNGQDTKHIKIAQLKGEKSIESASGELFQSGRFLKKAWDQNFKTNPEELMTITPATPEMDADLKEFEKDFAGVLDKKITPLYKAALPVTQSQIQEMDSVRWQLFYLLGQGIDMQNPKANQLFAKMQNEIYMGDWFLRQVIISNPLTSYNKLAEKLDELKSEMKELDRDANFKPAVSILKAYVDLLKAYKQ